MKKLLLAFLFPLMVFGQGTPTLRFNTVADMVARAIPTVNNSLTAFVTGRVTANDGGGGTFYYVPASAVTTNLGTIFKPNSVAGRWFRDYSGELNVKWFGAVGNGITDDISAFNGAISTVVSSGAIFVPSGHYLLSDTLRPAIDSITFRGVSSAYIDDDYGYVIPSTLQWTSGTTGLELSTNQFWKIDGLKFDGALVLTDIIRLGGNNRIQNCLIENAKGNGIHIMTNSWQTTLSRISLYGCKTNGILSDGTNSTSWAIQDSTISYNGFEGGHGVNIQRGDEVRITNTLIHDNYGYGLYINRTTASPQWNIQHVVVDQVTFIDNASVSGDAQVFIGADAALADGPQEILFQGQSLFESTLVNNAGIRVQNAGEVKVVDCNFLAKTGTNTFLFGTNVVNLVVMDSTFTQAPEDIVNLVTSGTISIVRNSPFKVWSNGQYHFWHNSTGDVRVQGATSPYTASLSLYSGAGKTAGISSIGTSGEVRIGGLAADFFPTLFSSNTEVYRSDVTSTIIRSLSGNGPISLIPNGSGKVDVRNDLMLSTVGGGVQIKEGSNARMGVSVLNGGSPGTVTVSNTSVTANTRIFLTVNTTGGTVGFPYVSARTAATSFTITSSANGDTSTVAWLLVEPSP